MARGFGFRRTAPFVRHDELVSASMAGPSLLCCLSFEGRPWTPGSGPGGRALKRVGIYVLQPSQELFPGESRGPDGTALPRMDPGFRRGSPASLSLRYKRQLVSGSMVCSHLKGGAKGELRPWMLKRVQHDERMRQRAEARSHKGRRITMRMRGFCGFKQWRRDRNLPQWPQSGGPKRSHSMSISLRTLSSARL